jgi:peptidoglycan DL-endopeptidase CwlO
VGLYIGDGMMVHARTYGSPVAVTSVDQRGFRFGVRLG